MVAVAVTEGLLSLRLDELISFGDLLQELRLRHHPSVLALLLVLEVPTCDDLVEAVTLAWVLGEHALDQFAERRSIRLVFEYFPELLLHWADQPLVVRVCSYCLAECRTEQFCHEYSRADREYVGLLTVVFRVQ